MSQRLALIIGNSIYLDGSLSRLLTPDADVGALGEVLLDPELGGFDDVDVLVNMSSHVIRRSIASFFTKRTREDLLILYFSGHGVLDDQGHLYLAVKDTDSNLLRGTAIPASYITEEMNNSRSQRQVLILDCCHSGAFARGTKGSPSGALGASVGTAAAFEGTGYGRVVLTASDATQYAWEGEQVIGKAENSLFTHYMLQGIKNGEADLNGDGQITIDELYDYVYEKVVRQTEKQTPGKWTYKEQGEIVVSHTPGKTLEAKVPVSLPEFDQNLEEKLEKLYNEGLSAYWLEDWDKSVRCFRALVEARPDYPEAATKLELSRRKMQVRSLYERALAAEAAGDWPGAITSLDELLAIEPGYRDAATRLEQAKRNRLLADLYAEARQLYKAGKWQAVVNVFARIANFTRDYPDPEGLLAAAQAKIAESERLVNLECKYNQALKDMDAGRWSQAERLLVEVQGLEPGYQAVDRLLERARLEVSRQQPALQFEEQISSTEVTKPQLYSRRIALFALGGLILLAVFIVLWTRGKRNVETIESVKTLEVVKTEIIEVAAKPTTAASATPEPEPSKEPLIIIPPVIKNFKNADTFVVIEGTDEQESLDPAWTYETRGSAIEANIYEGLVWFNREKTDEFIPALATDWSVNNNGLEWVFTIRQGVSFHEGGTLEPHDVAYTVQRNLLQGRNGGPQRFAYEGFFGSEFALASSKDLSAALKGKATFEELSSEDLADVCERVKAKIIADDAAGTVTFKLAQPMPWMLTLTAGNFLGAIVDQEWMVEQGDWDGTCDNWINWADPAAKDSLLFDRANGTGPYKLDHWTPGEETVLVANEKYWRTEPMWEGGPSGVARIPHVLIKYVEDWETRLSMLEAGDADYIYTPSAFRAQLYPHARRLCYFARPCEDANPDGYLEIWRELPEAYMTQAQPNWQINTEGGNPYIGSGKLDGKGIPPDFFSDLHVRKALNYCFNFQAMIDEALAGEGVQAQGPIPQGMMGYREGEAPLYSYDPAKCKEEFKLADVNHNGTPAYEDPKDVWDVGFYMQVAYNEGNETRRLAGEILKSGIEAINPKFSVQVIAMPWSESELQNIRSDGKLAVYVSSGWMGDFHDPHNWAQGYLPRYRNNMPDYLVQKYNGLIAQGAAEADLEARRLIYEQLQRASEEDAVAIWIYQKNFMVALQPWIKDYFFNPAYFQQPYTWVYALAKEAQ